MIINMFPKKRMIINDNPLDISCEMCPFGGLAPFPDPATAGSYLLQNPPGTAQAQGGLGLCA